MLPLLPQDEQAVKADLTEEKARTSGTASQDAGYPAVPNKDLNRRIALLSSLAAVGLFASQRLDLGGASLKDLAANAIPYEEVSSSRPLPPHELYAQIITEKKN